MKWRPEIRRPGPVELALMVSGLVRPQIDEGELASVVFANVDRIFRREYAAERAAAEWIDIGGEG